MPTFGALKIRLLCGLVGNSVLVCYTRAVVRLLFFVGLVLTKDERGKARTSAEEPQAMEKAELFVRWQNTQQPCHAVLRSNDELHLLQERIV